MANNDWKSRLGMVYSTNPDYQFETEYEVEQETLPKEQQRLRVRIEKNGRKGKTVTLVTGFIGKDEDLKDIAKSLKTRLCTGGTAKNGEIVMQGEIKEQVIDWLKNNGFRDVK